MHTQILDLIDQLEELSYNRGLARARLEAALLLSLDVPPAPAKGKPGRKPAGSRLGRTLAERVLAAMAAEGPTSIDQLVVSLPDASKQALRTRVSKLTTDGVLMRVGHGKYQRNNGLAPPDAASSSMTAR